MYKVQVEQRVNGGIVSLSTLPTTFDTIASCEAAVASLNATASDGFTYMTVRAYRKHRCRRCGATPMANGTCENGHRLRFA